MLGALVVALLGCSACAARGEDSAINTDPLAASQGFSLANHDISSFLPNFLAVDAVVEVGGFTLGNEFETTDHHVVSMQIDLQLKSSLFVGPWLPPVAAEAAKGTPASVLVNEPRGFDKADGSRDLFPSSLLGQGLSPDSGRRLFGLLNWADGGEQASVSGSHWGLAGVVNVSGDGTVSFPGLLQNEFAEQWQVLVAETVPRQYGSELDLLVALIAESGGVKDYPRPGSLGAVLSKALAPPSKEEQWLALPAGERPLDPELTPEGILQGLRRVAAVILSDVPSDSGARQLLSVSSEQGVSYRGTLESSRQTELFLVPDAAVEISIRPTDKSLSLANKPSVVEEFAFGSIAESGFLIISVDVNNVVSVKSVGYTEFQSALGSLVLAESIPHG